MDDLKIFAIVNDLTNDHDKLVAICHKDVSHSNKSADVVVLYLLSPSSPV